MRSLLSLLVVVGTSLSLAGSVAAQEENTKEKYPQDLVERPVILPKGMVELNFGAQSNFLADPSAGQDGVRSKFDLYFGMANRLQMGLETDVQWAPSDAFSVRDVALWGQYNVVPSTNIRFGGYMQIPRVSSGVTGGTELGDALFGIRIGLPMKFRAGENLSVLAMPRYSMDVSGDAKTKIFDLPVGIQVQLIVQLAMYLNTGVAVLLNDFELDNNHIGMPISGGFVFSPARLFDLGAELRIDDVTSGPGRDSRWVTFWIGIRR